MVKLALAILIFTLEINSYAYEQNVYLLTSLDTSKVPNFHIRKEEYYSEYTNKLENIFRNNLNSINLNIKVIHQTDGYTLSKILKSTTTYGVFYLGHSNGRNNAIYDFLKNNIKKSFYSINKNVKFIGIISCQSDKVIENIKNLYKHKNYFFGFKNNVLAKHGLIKAIKKFNEIYQSSTPQNKLKNTSLTKINSKAYKLLIKRSIPPLEYGQLAPPVFVEINKKVITILPAGRSSQVQEQMISLDISQLDKDPHLSTITVSNGSNLIVNKSIDKTMLLGQFYFEILDDTNSTIWKPLSKDGRPIGITTNIFIPNSATIRARQ